MIISSNFDVKLVSVIKSDRNLEKYKGRTINLRKKKKQS